jgi:hypothetical protein
MNCDAIPGSFPLVVGRLGTSLSNRAHRENFRRCFVKVTKYSYLHKDYKYFCKYNFNELRTHKKIKNNSNWEILNKNTFNTNKIFCKLFSWKNNSHFLQPCEIPCLRSLAPTKMPFSMRHGHFVETIFLLRKDSSTHSISTRNTCMQ